MNTQHTPGPWAILSPLNSHMVCDDNQQVVAVATNGNEEANARLIAAAPELLEALEAIESLPADDNGERVIPAGFLDKAREAIAKVR